MAEIKPIKVYGRRGPNPPKIPMLLEELNISYEIDPIAVNSVGDSDVKKEDYLAINPNGRIPAIYDPNTDITLWESGAIMEYIIEQYDPSHQLSFTPGTPEYYHAKQWLFFQTSGQGPSYGQFFWFGKYHSEYLPSAIDRYVQEANRITAVLEGHLAKQSSKHGVGEHGNAWIVGGKMSYVDLAWTPWQNSIVRAVSSRQMTKEQFDPEKYPHVGRWLAALLTREKVAMVLERART